MNKCANGLAIHYFLQVSYDVHVKHIDGQVVLLTHGGGGKVHDLKTTGVDLVVGYVAELSGCGRPSHGQNLLMHR